MSSDLSVSQHCHNISVRALQRVGMLFRAMNTKDWRMLVKAYKVFVRPVLESNTVVFSPHLKKDIECIERVQRHFTRRLFFRCFHQHPPYNERCEKLDLESLESRRVKFDLVMCYNIMHNLVDLKKEEFFIRAKSTSTRNSNSLKLFVPDCRINARKFFFSNRVIKPWNNLPEPIANARNSKGQPSVALFKERLNYKIHILPFCSVYKDF